VLRRPAPALDFGLMRYALSIAILSMLPSTVPGALSRGCWLEKHRGISALSLFHQSSADEEQLVVIPQQWRAFGSSEIEHSSSVFSRPSGA
jgi:hypothetical protein